MAKRRRRRSLLLWLLVRLGLVTLLALLALSAWFIRPFWALAGEFEKTEFSAPSRLYGRAEMLKLGEAWTQSDLEGKLERLGYWEGSGSLLPGEYEWRNQSLAIYTLPTWTQEELRSPAPLLLRLGKDRITHLEQGGQTTDQVLLGRPLLNSFYGPDRLERRPVSVGELPENVIYAVLAAEDAGFFEHRGLSFPGIARAAWSNVRGGSIEQGGSTLTQQLVKNLYLSHDRTWSRKTREMILAIMVDLKFSKEVILGTYLNEIYMGASQGINLIGVGAASWAYFGKEPSQLTMAEAATLAGIIPAPARYSPLTHPEEALRRRALVLNRLETLGWIEKEILERARQAPLLTHPQSLAKQAPYFVDAMRREARRRYRIPNLENAGFVLLSTLSYKDQKLAEESMEWGLDSLEKGWEKDQNNDAPLQGALLSVNPADGAILAWVGGRDWAKSQFDRVGQARRQTGSAFKPVVYAAAFASGTVMPATPVEDSPYTLRSGSRRWSPRNSDNRFRGIVSVRTALEKSLNVPTARVAIQTGLPKIVEMASAMGIRKPLPEVPSIALGAVEVTVEELTTVYATLAAYGRRPTLHGLEAVISPEGQRLRGSDLKDQSVMRPETAYLVTSVLQGVLDRGTGRSSRQQGLSDPLAGKTGTTNDRRDSWFAGYSPKRVSVVWVGYDDNTSTKLSGARAALPIWTRFVSKVRPENGFAPFTRPPGLVERIVDTQTGELATYRCPKTRKDFFLSTRAPRTLCREHRTRGGRAIAQPRDRQANRLDSGEQMHHWLDEVLGTAPD